MHLACIWIVAFAVNASAYFIIAANSFMQHPVGARFNPATGRAELTDFGALLTNNTAIWAFLHIVPASLLVAGAFVAGVCAWLMVRSRRTNAETVEAQSMYRPATILGCLVVLAASVALLFTGDVQGKLMFQQQPMKMASAESLCHTETDPDFSVLTVGTHNNCDSVTHLIEVPYVLPYLAESKFTGVTLDGVSDLQQEYQQRFGPGDYRPNLFVTYWAFRAMIGLMRGPGRIRARRAVVDARRPYSRSTLVRVVGSDQHSGTVPGQQRRLGVHRDGPPAVGGRAQPDR